MAGRAMDRLGPFLEANFQRYHRPELIASDPLRIPHAYADRADREVAAFMAAALSYGRVAQILKSAGRVLEGLGPNPAATLRSATARELRERLRGVFHRFNDDRDLACLAWIVAQVLREFGSLGEHFRAKAFEPMRGSADIHGALVAWTDALRTFDVEPFYPGGLPERASFHYLIPRPARGSACKRLHMLMRWLVRPGDGVDLGIWNFADPALLLMPVDTHVLRLSRHLGLTRRRDASLRTSREITAALRRLAPADPVRYDFALCRLGILAACPTRERLELCAACELASVCRRHATMQRQARGRAAA